MRLIMRNRGVRDMGDHINVGIYFVAFFDLHLPSEVLRDGSRAERRDVPADIALTGDISKERRDGLMRKARSGNRGGGDAG
jgi:hypothetical protein